MLKFSIVIPFYNSSKYLDRLFVTLNDYLNHPECEIIIVDDCSTEKEYEILKLYVESKKVENLILIRNQMNQGAAYTRQQGVMIAQGHYIAFLDADDGWVKNKAFILYDYMLKNNLDMVGGATQTIDNTQFDLLRNKTYIVDNSRRLSFNNFIFKNYFSTPAVMVKKEKFILSGFNCNLRYAEDYECWRRLTLICKVNYVVPSGTFSFKHVYLSRSAHSLSSNTVKMSIGELHGLMMLIYNPQVKITYKPLIILGIFYSLFKASLREIRVRLFG